MGLTASQPTPVPTQDPEYNRIINDLRSEARELKKQIESLKKINASLEKQRAYETESKRISIANSQKVRLSELSEQKIDEFVEEILKNKDINIGYLPDFVEKRIYKNVFTILVNLLDHVVDTTSVKLLGHEINFDFAPDDGEPNKHETKEMPKLQREKAVPQLMPQ